MSFDVCVSISEAELNQGAAAIYQKLYPGVFTGETQIARDGLSFTAQFDVQGPPVFGLQPAHAAESTANFTVRLAAVKLTLTARDTPPAALLLDVTAHCSIVSAGSLVSFVLNGVTAADQPDQFDQLVVKKFLLPSLQASLKQLFAGLAIPSFDIPGVPLGPPTVLLDQRRLFVLATVAGHGGPGYDPALPWPEAGFFALLSETALQAAASHAIASSGEMSHSGQSGNDAFEAYYHFSMRLVQPVVKVAGAGFNVSFTLTGSVGAGVHVLYVPITLSYSAQSVPSPTAYTTLVPQGSDLVVVESSLQSFTIACVPDGDIPSQVLSWMTEFIVQGVVGTLTPLVTAFLSGIRFTSLKIPAYVESVSGVTVTMTPANLSVSNVAGNIALAGSLRFD